MIAHLRGKLISKRPGQAVVEAGGVGYDVVISIPTFSELPAANAEVALHVHTHVREDALALYGFITNDEKQLFERLISVSGVGPKLAMTILSGMPSAAEIVGAIRNSDVARLTKIPGVGKKTAERLALELKDKLDAFGATPARPAGSPLEEDVLSALVNLGYQRPHAERAVAAAAANGGKSSGSFDTLFRQALASLSK
jgi:Holliday junction DNA helicase RuvA